MLLLILAAVGLHPISANATPAGVEAIGAVGTASATVAAFALPAGVEAIGAVGTASATGAAFALPAGVVSAVTVGSVQIMVLVPGVRGVAVPTLRIPVGVAALDRPSRNSNWWRVR